MHKVGSFGVMALNLVWLSFAPGLQDSAFLIAKDRAGALHTGMTVDEVYRRFGPDRNVKLVDLRAEGFFTPALKIYLPSAHGKRPSLIAQISCKGHRSSSPVTPDRVSPFVVNGITVYDRTFRTHDGLGVGSTYGDLRKLYPGERPAAGEGSVLVAPSGLGISFSLDVARIPNAWYKTGRRNSNLIPDDTAVIAVLIYGSPAP